MYREAFAAISGLLGAVRALLRPREYYGRTLRRLARRASPLMRALFLAWLTLGAMLASFILSGLAFSYRALREEGLLGPAREATSILAASLKVSVAAPLAFGAFDTLILYLLVAALEGSRPPLTGLLLVRMSSVLPYTGKAIITAWRGGGLVALYAYTLQGGGLGAVGLLFTLAGAGLTAYGLSRSLGVSPRSSALSAGGLWLAHLLAGLLA
jgi:hypothetical protein